MDNKLKLNVKMNVAVFKCDFWLWLTKLTIKGQKYALDKAKNMKLKELNILSEMLKEDYDESYKELIRRGINIINKDHPA